MSEHMLAPTDAAPDEVFRDGLARGELRFQRCGQCSTAVHYPRVLCPRCGSGELSWQRSTGAGVVYSATALRSRDGVRSVLLVDLDEGFRMMSRIEGSEPDQVAIGARVVFDVVDEEGTPVAVFREEDQ